MSKIYLEDVIGILMKYKEISNIVGLKNSDNQLIKIEQMVALLSPHRDLLIESLDSTISEKVYRKPKRKSKKISFNEIVMLFENEDFENLKRVKLDYTKLDNSSKVISYLESNPIEQVLKSTTLIDLNLLYYILTGDKREIKKNKTYVYNMITGYIKSYKQGNAFSKLLLK